MGMGSGLAGWQGMSAAAGTSLFFQPWQQQVKASDVCSHAGCAICTLLVVLTSFFLFDLTCAGGCALPRHSVRGEQQHSGYRRDG